MTGGQLGFHCKRISLLESPLFLLAASWVLNVALISAKGRFTSCHSTLAYLLYLILAFIPHHFAKRIESVIYSNEISLLRPKPGHTELDGPDQYTREWAEVLQHNLRKSAAKLIAIFYFWRRPSVATGYSLLSSFLRMTRYTERPTDFKRSLLHRLPTIYYLGGRDFCPQPHPLIQKERSLGQTFLPTKMDFTITRKMNIHSLEVSFVYWTIEGSCCGWNHFGEWSMSCISLLLALPVVLSQRVSILHPVVYFSIRHCPFCDCILPAALLSSFAEA